MTDAGAATAPDHSAELNAGRPVAWTDADPPGGFVCAEPDPSRPGDVCGNPVESEPCGRHASPAPPAATPGQAAYEARQRSHWERRLHRHGDRPPTPWADLTAGQRADEDAAAQAAITIAVAAERERIRQMAIACRAAAVSPTGRMTPFAELLERSPEENAAALLKVVEDARTGLGGGDHA